MIKRLSIAAVVVLVCRDAGTAQEQELVGHWDFNDGGGRILRDSSGHGNHGEIHGARWARTGNGYALRFDGLLADESGARVRQSAPAGIGRANPC
jgi:hypothetical protein